MIRHLPLQRVNTSIEERAFLASPISSVSLSKLTRVSLSLSLSLSLFPSLPFSAQKVYTSTWFLSEIISPVFWCACFPLSGEQDKNKQRPDAMAVNHEARALLRDARCAVREGGVGDNASRVCVADKTSDLLPARKARLCTPPHLKQRASSSSR